MAHVKKIEEYLDELRQNNSFEVETIKIAEQPHLVEHFKLIATPALVKVSPAPYETLAGTQLIEKLKKCWPQWTLETNHHYNDSKFEVLSTHKNNYSSEVLKLSDEVFRLKQEKEELQKQIIFKDQILAMLAHDLRSPLTAASIAVETLELSETQLSKERGAQIKPQIYKQAKQQFQLMNRMITDILQASKTVNSSLRVVPSKLELPPLAHNIVDGLKEIYDLKNQTLTMDVPQDLPSVYGDEELLRQVMVNLLENASKYTPHGGQIKLAMLHRTSQKVQVSVSDTGPGIPKEKYDSVFEGHFRLKRDLSQEGYGLGLSLCRKVIQAHYGQIWIDNNPGQGCTFHFTLPIYR
jgi:two-component system clock-associated histidine kinase SasA